MEGRLGVECHSRAFFLAVSLLETVFEAENKEDDDKQASSGAQHQDERDLQRVSALALLLIHRLRLCHVYADVTSLPSRDLKRAVALWSVFASGCVRHNTLSLVHGLTRLLPEQSSCEAAAALWLECAGRVPRHYMFATRQTDKRLLEDVLSKSPAYSLLPCFSVT